MLPITWNTFTRGRGQLLGWGLVTFIWAFLILSLWDTVQSQQAQFQQLLASYPPEFTAFFGDMSAFATPVGYLSVEFFTLMPLILGVFAVIGGSWLITADEERGLLDLYLANPIRRGSFFAGRVLGLTLLSAGILAFGYVGLVIAMGPSSLSIPLTTLALPFLSLFAVLSLYSSLGVFLSQALPSGRTAAMGSGFGLFAGYLLHVLGRWSEDYRALARFTPFAYYQGGDALEGVRWGWIAGLLAISIALLFLAGVLFQRRDLRVSGEGSWGWARWLPRRRNAAAKT